MTIEQLEKANEINRKIENLRRFRYKRSSEYMGIVFGEEELSLIDFPDLKDFILGYLSDKIVELKEQLEEL